MTEDEIDQRAREAYAASAEEGMAQLPWPDLPAFARKAWLDLAQGDAGAAVD